MSRAVAALALAMAHLAACHRGDETRPAKEAAPAAKREEPRPGSPEADATALGRNLYVVVDQAESYRDAHAGKPAKSLRQMGLDSLAGPMVRRVQVTGKAYVITVAWRDAAGHEIQSCSGDQKIIEDAALNTGGFTVACNGASGEVLFQVRR